MRMVSGILCCRVRTYNVMWFGISERMLLNWLVLDIFHDLSKFIITLVVSFRVTYEHVLHCLPHITCPSCLIDVRNFEIQYLVFFQKILCLILFHKIPGGSLLNIPFLG